MGKSLPRKCNSCAKTYKGFFVRHAKACPAGFTKWTFLDRSGAVIPKEKLKKNANRIHDATDGVKADLRMERTDNFSRSWRKIKRKGESACNLTERLEAWTHLFALIRVDPNIHHDKLDLLLLEFSKSLTK